MGLERKGSVPLIAFVSRLYDQKGLSLLGDWLSDLEAQFVFLGEGDANHEVMLSDLAARYPKSIAGFIGFDEVLARQIYAGADIFLMPSLFEPCGLGQMISARYGTIPVVRHVGGLKDTVDGNIGFYFRDFSQKSLQICLKKVIKVYKFNHKKWLKLKKNCLKKDFSWKKSALKYLDLYRKISSKI
jgi:starch synthase